MEVISTLMTLIGMGTMIAGRTLLENSQDENVQIGGLMMEWSGIAAVVTGVGIGIYWFVG